jgi:dTMP kinase
MPWPLNEGLTVSKASIILRTICTSGRAPARAPPIAPESSSLPTAAPGLEELGQAVLDTGMTRSPLAGSGIRRAKEGNNLGRVTQSLFYATDFVDRMENEIAPALRAGFIVLTDRYIYSLMARALVRGVDPAWIRSLYSVALKPDAVFYLRVGVEQLIPRVIFSRGFDYWESGMDLYPARDMYEGFCNYQTALLAEFDRLSIEYGFERVEASREPKMVFSVLKDRILNLLEGSQKPRLSRPAEEQTGRPSRMAEAKPGSRIVEPKALPALEPVARFGNGNG